MKRQAFLAGAAGFSFLGERGARGEGLRIIRAGGPPQEAYRSIQYGIASGIFEKYGLTVEATIVSNGSAAAAALIGGAIDIAVGNVLTLFQAHLHGVPMTALATDSLITNEHTNVFTLVLKDSPIHTGRDLNGKTVASPGLGDIISVSTLDWIDQNGGDSKSVRVLEVGSSAALPVLEQGRADAISINEPFVGQALATGKVRVLASPLVAIAKRYAGGVLVVLEPFVQQNLDLMTRLAHGIHDSAVYCNTHLPETVALVSSYTRMRPEVVAKMRRSLDPEYLDPGDLQPVIDALAKYGVLERSFRAEDVISAAALKPAPR